MIHYYKSTRHDNKGGFQRQRFCDHLWLTAPTETLTNQQRRVTCPKCLEILIEKAEEILTIMRANRELGKNERA